MPPSDETAAAPAAGAARPSARVAAVALIAIVCLAAALRFHGLAAENLWTDEGTSLVLSGGDSLAEVVTDVAARDSHPPLYLLLLHLWRRAFGSSDFAIRSLSALLGAACVPAIFLVGSTLYDRRVGLGAALVVAALPVAVRFSQEARSYALLSLLMICLWYLAVQITRRERWTDAAGFALVAPAIVYTHYWGGPVVTAAVLVAVALNAGAPERRRRLIGFLPGLALMALGFAPWAWVIAQYQLATAQVGTSFATGVSPVSIVGVFGRPFGAFLEMTPAGVVALLVALASAALVAATPGRARAAPPATPGARWWCLGMLVIPVVLIAAIAHLTTFWVGIRVPNLTMVPTGVICAAAVVGLWDRRHRVVAAVLAGAIAGLCVAGVWRIYSERLRPDWEGITAVIAAHERPGDVVVIVNGAWNVELFERYYRGSLPAVGLSNGITDPARLRAAIRDIWPDGGRLWLILISSGASPVEHIMREMSAGEQRFRVGFVRFIVFESRPPPPPGTQGETP